MGSKQNATRANHKLYDLTCTHYMPDLDKKKPVNCIQIFRITVFCYSGCLRSYLTLTPPHQKLSSYYCLAWKSSFKLLSLFCILHMALFIWGIFDRTFSDDTLYRRTANKKILVQLNTFCKHS